MYSICICAGFPPRQDVPGHRGGERGRLPGPREGHHHHLLRALQRAPGHRLPLRPQASQRRPHQGQVCRHRRRQSQGNINMRIRIQALPSHCDIYVFSFLAVVILVLCVRYTFMTLWSLFNLTCTNYDVCICRL